MTLRHVGFTPVPPGPKPGFDHADTHLDPRGSQLFVAHMGADRVDILDCRSGTYLGAITDLPGVAGVLIDTEQDLFFTSYRAAGRGHPVPLFGPDAHRSGLGRSAAKRARV